MKNISVDAGASPIDPDQPSPPATPGAALRAAIKAMGWLQADLADVLQITPATVSDLCQDRRGISYRMAHRLGDAFGNGALYWATLQSAYKLSRARAPRPGIIERRDALIARKAAADRVATEEQGRRAAEHAYNTDRGLT